MFPEDGGAQISLSLFLLLLLEKEEYGNEMRFFKDKTLFFRLTIDNAIENSNDNFELTSIAMLNLGDESGKI